tara:strand:+ start:1135 stop:1647 length:513 start_codon:yes stop_codon:yes gene_type:complete
MFFILTFSALMFFPMLFKKKKVNRRYEQVSICAVNEDHTEIEVTTPSQLPENINYFIITYTVADVLYKICRNSVTVPQVVKKIGKYRCTKAVAIDELGNTRDVTDLLEMYSGPVATFIGNDISVIDILKHHDVNNVYSVLTVARDTSWLGIFQDPVIMFHTTVNITSMDI